MSDSSNSAVEKIDSCYLSQWQICDINPRLGAALEATVKRSLEKAVTSLGLVGTCRLVDDTGKSRKPDILLDICGRSLSFDCRHWTATASRHDKVYLSREFYGTARRGKPSLSTYLKDSSRFLYVAFELALTNGQGTHQRRLFLTPGIWLKNQFDCTTGIDIDDIAETWWPGCTKGADLLYDLDLYKLIEIADDYQAGRRV